MENLALGLVGEKWAEDFLRKKGYRILEKDFRTPFGQIDIIACEKKTICFIEVKTRSNVDFGLPEEAVSKLKQTRIIKTALSYLKQRGLLHKKTRFDVVSIVYKNGSPQIDLIRGAFESER